MNSDGFNIVSGGSRLRRVEVTKEAVAPSSIGSCAELGHPLPVTRVKRYALIAAGVVRSLAAIRAVLGYRSYAKIGPAIVESFASANVVNLLFWRGTFDLSVHEDAYGLASGGNSAGGVVRFGVGVPVGKPVPLHEPFVVRGINCGVESPGERNEFYGLVRRLLDIVTFNLNFHSAIVAL